VAGSIFINRIHYDNAGTDISINEGVEIAGIAGYRRWVGKLFLTMVMGGTKLHL
jgi:hypothetical protein